MKKMNARTIGLTGMLVSMAFLGGCVATGPVGYDGYPYEYGAPHVGVDVYPSPGYQSYPAYPYYDGRPGYDRRWYGRDRPVPVPVPVPAPRAVPVPVPVPVPTPAARPHGGHVSPPGHRGPGAPGAGPGMRPSPPGRVMPGLPTGRVRESDNTRDQP